MRDDILIRGKKIYVWGCGKNASIFMRHFRLYLDAKDTEMERIWEECFAGFIDSNKHRQGDFYEEKQIVSPEAAFANKMDYCIITVLNNSEIIEWLQQHGYSGQQWIYWKDYLKHCKCGVLEQRAEILKRAERKDERLIRYLLFSEEIDHIQSGSQEQYSMLDIYKGHPYLWISALEWYFEDELNRASEWWMQKDMGEAEYTEEFHGNIQTIGIIIDRYYSSGIAKVVSLLLKGFLERQYTLILITEEEVSEKDYDLPKSVIRYSLKEPFNGAMEERLKRLESCISTYKIDILCFHTGYSRTECFYEILLAKMLGLPTVLVLHSALRAVMNDQKEISDQFPFVYRMADEMVALSYRDQAELAELDCSCTYIPNPIENFGLKDRTHLLHKDTYQVLWVGRIVQRAKQVLDTVEIMKLVTAKMSNVTLRIIGERVDSQIYDRLISMIHEEGLEEKITVSPYQQDLQEVYRESDVVLVTSSTESFYNVLAEAKVSSRPVVMYELPWLSLVQDGRGIISVGQGNTYDAAEAIVCLLSNKDLLEKYSIEAWESIQPFLEYDVISDWESVFEKVRKKVCRI